jgi:Endonuclease/Exonuclease/phosphatase family
MPSAPPRAHLRLATWNVEWFTALFDVNGRPLHDGEYASRYKVTRAQQLDAIAAVLRAADPDALVVVEAPDTNGRRNTVRALERFAAWAGLRQRRALTGFISETEQEIAFLFDPDHLAARHDPKVDSVPRFDGRFHYDLDTDATPEVIRFDKPPLELAVDVPGGRLRLIGAHLKSKNPRNGGDPAEEVRVAIENRRKQLAQCLWLRARVENHLSEGDDLIVLGDFNDGPGLDEYERLFGRSGVEIVLGHDTAPALRLYDPHAAMALSSRIGVTPTTARFYIKPPGRYFQALLDFIMVSPGLAARHPQWRIWHPFDDPQISADAALRDALLTASDHFPVTIDIPISVPA